MADPVGPVSGRQSATVAVSLERPPKEYMERVARPGERAERREVSVEDKELELPSWGRARNRGTEVVVAGSRGTIGSPAAPGARYALINDNDFRHEGGDTWSHVRNPAEIQAVRGLVDAVRGPAPASLVAGLAPSHTGVRVPGRR